MSLKTTRTPRAVTAVPLGALPPGGPLTLPENIPSITERGVLVHHGIHSGSFPIAGMKVKEARAALTPLLNVDPQAVAVINGQLVSEEQVIGDEVKLLSFVKRSAVKG